MRRILKLLAIIMLITSILATFTSCGTGRLNADFAAIETGELNNWVNFYGNSKFETYKMEYLAEQDVHMATHIIGTYKIFEDKSNPNQLLIEFKTSNGISAVYTYEEIRYDDGSMSIKFDGREFKSIAEHPTGYIFWHYLYNLGLIK